MIIFNTNIPVTSFSIILIEIVFFSFQIIYYLSRPSDQARLWYLLLLLFLLYYNIASVFIPNENWSMPHNIQIIIAYASGVPMSMYFAYYFYKAFNLERLKFFATWGTLLFILLPFSFVFTSTYLLTGNIFLARVLFILIPSFYIIAFIYTLSRAAIAKYKTIAPKEKKLYVENIVAVYLALLFWITLPIWVVLGMEYEQIEQIMTNMGFLIMTVSYVRTSVINSKREYQRLMDSESNLREKVLARTKKLEQLNEQITNTFITIAHETKTPLTLINNYLDEYMEKVKGSSGQEELSIVKSNVEKLTQGVVDFFDTEKFKRGFFIYDNNLITDFSKLLNESITLFKYYALQRKIKIIDTTETDLLVKADPEAITRIVNNLMDNALKYTNEGGEINVSLIGYGNSIHFIVADNGIGIDPQDQKTIFEPYYQINSTNRNSHGMGMGLPIVKKIVESLKGQIGLDSRPNKGAKFEIVFKKYCGEEPAVSGYKIKSTSREYRKYEVADIVTDTERPNLLLIEDNLELLNYLIKKLKERYNLYVAQNGLEALEKLNHIDHLDIIISDIMMDHIDGYDVLKTVSENKRFTHVPFIFLTAKTNGDRANALKLGAIDYINKPFKIGELINKIESFLIVLKKQRTAVIDQAYRSISKNGIEKADKNRYFKFDLTNREIEITNLIKQGKNNKTIGDALHISPKTVAKHIQNIYEKTGCSAKTELLHKLQN